ncbi:MAG TPA: hypothetical protein VEG60_29895 [Candidatus Binatia bacterium]|nr:hypothetical protein [Candidatus Binatia bacterium]
MPCKITPCNICNTVRTYSIRDFNALDFRLLEKAAITMGASNVYADQKSLTMSFRLDGQYVELKNGQLAAKYDAEAITTRLKIAYARKVIFVVARRFRHMIVKEPAPNRFTIGWRS